MVALTDLIECFRDTRRRYSTEPELCDRTLRAMAGTRLYLSAFEAVLRPVKSESSDIEVTPDTTFSAARKLIAPGARVAVLNFANAYSPGGGVTRGAMAQEECLCRSSNLYACLTLPYLTRNYYKHNSRTTGDLGTDAVIYSSGVTVFKTDDALPLPMDDWFEVDVLTCAAPYNNPDRKKPFSDEELEAAFEGRVRNILEVAVCEGADRLVLGAFGCGAFNNPPELVAGVFRRLLKEEGYRRYFKDVVFAVKPGGNHNFEVFRDALCSG